MRNKLLSIILLSGLFSASANAGVVLLDNFDSENGGATSLNYTGFTNFNSIGGGDVDLVSTPNPYGISCVGSSGACVDLDGSPGPGKLESKSSFSVNTGDFVRFSFDLSGNQRNSASDGFGAGFDFNASTQLINYGFNFGAGDSVVFANTTTSNISTSSSILGNAGFGTFSLFFTAGSSGMFTFNIGSSSADNIGPMLDNIKLEISSVPEPTTLTLLGLGLAGLGLSRSRKRKFR